MLKKISNLIILVLLLSCTSKKPTPVAMYKNGSITDQDILATYKKLDEQRKNTLKTSEDYFKLIRKLAIEDIIYKKALEDGLDKSKNTQDFFKDLEKNIGFEILRKQNVLDKVSITKADYKVYTKQYELYQIVKRHNNNDKNYDQKMKNLLNKTRKQIKNLDDFKKAASKISDDFNKDEGGRVGFTRLDYMDQKIDDFMKKGKLKTVSEIIETYAGYHLLFINSERIIPIEDLITDRQLYDIIYTEKSSQMEEQWYKKLLNSKELTIFPEKLYLNDFLETEPIVLYKSKIITKKEVNNKIKELRQGVFPQPTQEELVELTKNLAIKLIIQDMLKDEKLVTCKEYTENVSSQKKYYLIREYINKNIKIKDIKTEDIESFYNDNIATLFTHIDEQNEQKHIQPMNEVIKFIKQKLETKNKKDAKYDLYRELITENSFRILDKNLEKLIKKIEKQG